jgi:glucose/arabinose dehydrogenase
MAERVTTGLHFPTSIAFDSEGRAWVAESGLPFGGAPGGGRVARIEADGSTTVLARDLRFPVTGLLFHEGAFYVSEGGNPGRISRIGMDGARTDVVDGLPGLGNYHVNMPLVGPDGKLYFAQGAATNSGVVGLDAHDLGWLRRLPHNHDIPGIDVTLAGESFETPDPRVGGDASNVGRSAPPVAATTRTGVFLPFGTAGEAGQRIPGKLPCTAAVMRCDLDGSNLELFAWGLRSAFGLLFLPDGRLLAADQGPDERGSRPIGKAPDVLFEVLAGKFYGWPDFIDGRPETDEEFVPTHGPRPTFVLADHASLPPLARPLMRFPVNSAATKMDVIPAGASRYAGHILVCLFGDERPVTGPAGPRVGRTLARIDPSDWSLHHVPLGPFYRPIDVKMDPSGEHFHVLDFGHFELTKGGMDVTAGTGTLWRASLAEL